MKLNFGRFKIIKKQQKNWKGFSLMYFTNIFEHLLCACICYVLGKTWLLLPSQSLQPILIQITGFYRLVHPLNGTPLQYSCLETPMDRGAWWAAVHGVEKSLTGLSDFTFTFHFHALEKEMATCSSVLAWRIPGTGEPGGLPSMGSHRVGHD